MPIDYRYWFAAPAPAPGCRSRRACRSLQVQRPECAEIYRVYPFSLYLRLARVFDKVWQMERKPIEPTETVWIRHADLKLGLLRAEVYRRIVPDGILTVLIGNEPDGLHLSISHQGAFDKRYPTWDEIAEARYRLLPADLEFVMHLPPMEHYVSLHDTTFHLHQLRE